MSTNVALAAADGGDPRMSQTVIRDDSGPNSAVRRLLHDPSIKFEEYRYYAEKTRAEEREAVQTEEASVSIWQVIFPTKSDGGVKPISSNRGSDSELGTNGDEKRVEQPETPKNGRRLVVTDTEWTNASRAVRTASGAACFYLITTDVLGPFGIAYVTPEPPHATY